MSSKKSSPSLNRYRTEQQQSPEQTYREKLLEIYDFSSEIFKITIDSPQSLFESLTALINDIRSLKKENDKMQSKAILNNQDLFSSSDLSDKSQQNQERSKITRYKRQVCSMQRTINDQQTQISDYETKIHEFHLKTQNYEARNIKYEQEISKLKKLTKENKNSNNKITNNESDSSQNVIESTVSLFEDVIRSQSKEIISLSEQREELSANIQLMDQIMSKIESEYLSLEVQKDAMTLSLKASQEKNSNIETMIPQMIDEIRKLNIPYSLISKANSIQEFVIETITNIAKSNTENISVENDQTIIEKVPKAQYELVLKQLEGSVKFIQNIANVGQQNDKQSTSSDNNENSVLYDDKIARTLLLTQCARIGHFIDKNNFTVEIIENNIFDPKILTSTEKVFAPLIEKVSPEMMAQSPTRELYALLVGVCEVNKMMMNYIEEFENEKYAKNQNLEFQEKEIENMKTWKNEHENKLQTIGKQIGMSDSIPIDELFDKIIEKYFDTFQENKKLQNEIERSRSDSIDKEQSTMSMMKQQLESVENQTNKEKAMHQKELLFSKNENISLKNEVINLKENLTKLNEAIAKKEKKYKKARIAQKETYRIIESVEEKVRLVSEENENLNFSLEEMNEVLKKQNLELSKSSEKIQFLHQKKNLLKDRIQELESQKETVLREIKLRNEALNDKYLSTIQSLESSIKEVREDISKAEDEREKAISQKNEISNQLIKLKVSERALKIKLEALETRSTLSRRENETQKSVLMHSIKAEVNSQLDSAKFEHEKMKFSIVRMLEEKFKSVVFTDDNPSDDEIIRKIDLCLKSAQTDQMKIKDVNEAREILGIPENHLMSKDAKSIAESIKQLLKQNAEFRAQSDEVKKKLVEIDQRKIEQEKALKTSKEWELWSRSIFYQITDGSSAANSARDIRYVLEEALLSTIGHRGMLAKLEVLRAEKKILRKNGKFDMLDEKGYDLIRSVRPIMVALMCARRLQTVSHVLPVRMSPKQRVED